MLIASLAAMRAREATLQEVLLSLLAQTRPPDKIVVHYSQEPWHLDQGWEQPPRVLEHPSIELCKVPNLGSMRKYLFTARTYRDANPTIVLVDDDRVWHPAVFDHLVDFVHRTGCVATTRGWSSYRLTPDAAGKPILRAAAIEGHTVKVPTRVQVANSGWATCFRAAHVDARLFDPQLHDELEMRYTDEIVLSALLTPPKYVVPMRAKFYAELKTDVHQWRSPRSTQAKLKQLDRYEALREFAAGKKEPP